ncbi:diguanylate cyclase (GGDEF)-like protein/PAS domain S-box-containing protein [Luteibacter sp. Sphag1AF]|uniref:GGDEF domain-containing protein n=1 Tax=Luteibacter sp. Sphag1AF TaxID=2587031 RepID=UPI00179ABEAC|nr:sensor domain-containing diguanylate cyclase [Luteibacter sp. Sphag1AF]MBB3225531.1 diguanylate cyclase (GGDEF)-like protein/PAS domain S-box-containing protein [Luteibacter sp. Sphag1AF]
MSDVMGLEIENDLAVYKTLLESTNAIPWKIDWDTQSFAYVGPQLEQLLGWETESWRSVQDWANRMHPEDRTWAVDFCVAQSIAGVDHEADYRALTKTGEYVWIRDVVHVVRKPDGTVDSLIGFMFDISERKQTEHKLLALQKELEDMSFKDGLTGIANRRRFDTVLDHEWADARRSREPLSLIMLDIDFFKQYNDHYGHLQGDACLRQIGALLSGAATRPRDFYARFGGEEFAMVLPETDEASAHAVAARCRELIARAGIVHEASPQGMRLTVSIGVATAVPGRNDGHLAFLDLADRRLYEAKQRGRDQIV